MVNDASHDAHSQGHNTQRPLVIVVHSSVGSGHRNAAQAVAQAMDTLCGVHPNLPANTEIAVLDILDYGYVRFDGDATANVTVVFSSLYDFVWHHTFTGRLLWGGGWLWSPLMFQRFTDLVRERKPIAIVATHIVAANAAVAARMVTKQRFPLVCVPTDYGAEGFWPHQDCDLICAADDTMVDELLPRHVPREKIKVTGIPVRLGFDEPCDRDEVLGRFGLPGDKLIVMVMAGARLSQPYMPFRQIVDRVLPQVSQFPHMHFAVLAGADDDYAARLRTIFDERGIANATVFKYIENIPELMNSSDMIVAKSGGLATTECICARLPLILVGHPYGQERANTLTVTAAGAALTAETSDELMAHLRRIHDDPQVLKTMLDDGDVLRRPRAALDVANSTLDLVGKIPPILTHPVKFYWGKKPFRVR